MEIIIAFSFIIRKLLKLIYALLLLLLTLRMFGQAPPAIFISPGLAVTNTLDTLAFDGDIINQGTYQSTGGDYFISSHDQTVSGIFTGINHFGTIVKKNSGNIIAKDDLVASKLIFLTDGTLVLGPYGKNLMITDPSPNAISGYSSNRFIDVGDSSGSITRPITSTRSGDWYDFPVGSNSFGYHPLGFHLTDRGNVSDSLVTVRLRSGNPGSIQFSHTFPTGFSGSLGQPCITGTEARVLALDCLAYHYWETSGPPMYETVVRTWDKSRCGFNGPSRIVSEPWDSVISTTQSIPDDLCAYSEWTGATDTILGGVYTGFGKRALAGYAGSPLAVTLIDFTARSRDDDIELTWKTQLEVNHRGFRIFRSTDGRVYTEQTFVPSQSKTGSSTTPLHYITTDTPEISGTYYYQLISEDFDGSRDYSPIRSVTYEKPFKEVFTIGPNPCNEILHVQSLLPIQNIEICNPSGSFVFSKKNTETDITTETVPMESFPPGMYYVLVTNTSETRWFSITKN